MKLKSILSLLGSAVISYVLFYFVTSEFIYRVYSGSSTLIIPLMITLLIAQTAVIFMIIRLITDKTVDRSCVIILWIAYAFAMAVLLFGRPVIDYQAQPEISGLNRQYMIQILLNLICFMPVGYLFRKQPWGRMIVISILLILCVEILQWITHRGVFDVMDIIAGTLGIGAGYAFTHYIPSRTH